MVLWVQELGVCGGGGEEAIDKLTHHFCPTYTIVLVHIYMYFVIYQSYV